MPCRHLDRLGSGPDERLERSVGSITVERTVDDDIDAADYRIVLLGDLGEEAQERLLRSSEVGRADLVKVAHHGSADQSTRLYREVGAAVGIIGVGPENGYGHPTDRLLELLGSFGTAAIRSDLSGTAVLTADGDGSFRLWSERAGTDVGPRP